jgi:hypothetical protein
MRACFLGQNIFALGYGIAVLQSPPLVIDEPKPRPPKPTAKPARGKSGSAKSASAKAPVKPMR